MRVVTRRAQDLDLRQPPVLNPPADPAAPMGRAPPAATTRQEQAVPTTATAVPPAVPARTLEGKKCPRGVPPQRCRSQGTPRGTNRRCSLQTKELQTALQTARRRGRPARPNPERRRKARMARPNTERRSKARMARPNTERRREARTRVRWCRSRRKSNLNRSRNLNQRLTWRRQN